MSESRRRDRVHRSGRGWDPTTRASGFTLIELVMVIAVTGALAVGLSRFLAAPVASYLDVERRAMLVDAADVALTRLTREIRLAVPNSVRVSGTGNAVELIRVRTGGRYRVAGADPLDFTAASDTFDVIGGLNESASIDTSAGAVAGDCVNGTTDCLVLYNTGQTGANAYAGNNVAAIRAASSSAVSFVRASPFPFASAAQRFYVADTPVSFVCDTAAGTLRRYDDYPLTAAHTAVDSHAELLGAGATARLVVNQVERCNFSYQAGVATRGGLLTLTLTLNEAGESVSLLQQVHVENLP